MITKEDRALARKTIERLDRYESGSPRMVQALAEIIEDVRTRAWAEGFSRGSAPRGPEEGGPIIARTIVSEPGAAIEVTELTLSPSARAALNLGPRGLDGLESSPNAALMSKESGANWEVKEMTVDDPRDLEPLTKGSAR